MVVGARIVRRMITVKNKRGEGSKSRVSWVGLERASAETPGARHSVGLQICENDLFLEILGSVLK